MTSLPRATARRPCGWRERRPALALLDVQMPKTNGYEVTRGCAPTRRRGHGDHHPHRAVRDTELARAFDAGADDFLRKPFSPQELKARVQAVLGRQ